MVVSHSNAGINPTVGFGQDWLSSLGSKSLKGSLKDVPKEPQDPRAGEVLN